MEENLEIDIDHDLRSDSIESHLSAMDSPMHPWYLSTKAMFRIVNKATTHLTVNHLKFEQSLHGITELTKFIDDKTARGAVYINLEKAQSLIDKLDAIRSDQFVVLNDGHDYQRIELSTALRNLEASITDQKNLAAAYLSTKAQESQELNGTGSELGMKVGLQDTVGSLRSTLPTHTYQYPSIQSPNGEELGGVQRMQFLSYFLDLYHALDSRAAAASTLLLTHAQPYVHAAYQRGNPVVASLHAQWTQPLLNSVIPLVSPLLTPVRDRVQQTNAALRQNALVGGYLSAVYDQAQSALEQVSMYCIAPTVPTIPATIPGLSTIPTIPPFSGGTVQSSAKAVSVGAAGVVGNIDGMEDTGDSGHGDRGNLKGVRDDVMVAEDVNSPQEELTLTEELTL